MDIMYSPPTLSEKRVFFAQYMYLVSFLNEFLDLYDRVKSLQEVVTDCLGSQEFTFDSKVRTVQEGRAFMQQNELPWTLITSASNRCFDTKEEAFTWLSDALDQIEATLQS